MGWTGWKLERIETSSHNLQGLGWDEVELETETQADTESQVGLAPSRPERKRRRGRPRKQQEIVPAQPDPAEQRRAAFFESTSLIGTTVAKKMFLKFRDAIIASNKLSTADQVFSTSKTLVYLEQNRPLMNIRAVADSADTSRQTVPRDFQRVSASLILCANQFWGLLLLKIGKCISDKLWDPIAFIKVRRYDETPTKLRVQYEGASESATAKVYQSMFDLAALVYDSKTSRYLLIHGNVPCPLMCVDRGTAETAASVQKHLERSVPELERVSRMFPLKISLPTTDRAPAMLLAEKILQRNDPTWIKCHMTCDVHRASQVQSAAMNLVPGHVSGLIAAALSMHLAGSKATLRKLLYEIVDSRLQIKVGQPPEWIASHRTRLYDLLLGESSDGKRKSSPLTLLWRRHVLSFFLNGDITDLKTVTFWSPFPISRSHYMQQFKHFAIPALVSSVCPTFPRSRWHGGHLAVNWAALLQCHHGLLTPLLQKWANQQITIPRRITQNHSEQPCSRTNQTGWNFDTPSGNRVHVDPNGGFPTWYDPESISFQEPMFETGSTGDFDWAAWNRAQKKKAAAWATSNNLDSILLVMRLSMTGPMRMMFSFLKLAGEQWETEQEHRMSQGFPRTYRIVDAARHIQMNAFWKELCSILFREHHEICYDGATRTLRALFFRLLSRVGCAAEQLIGVRRKSYPFALFRVLSHECDPNVAAAAVFADPPCLYDELTRRLLHKFDTPEKLSSPEARAVLLALARMMHLDISQIEAQHAAVRRVSTLMSVQTHKSAFETVNAQFIIRQQVIHRAFFQQLRDGPVPKHGRSIRRGKEERKKKGSGGAWRAYVRFRCSGKGRKFNRHEMTEIASDYQAIKGTPAFLQFADVGRAATAAAKAGHRPFPRKRVRESRQTMPTLSVTATASSNLTFVQAKTDLAKRRKVQNEMEREVFVDLAKYTRASDKQNELLPLENFQPDELQFPFACNSDELMRVSYSAPCDIITKD